MRFRTPPFFSNLREKPAFAVLIALASVLVAFSLLSDKFAKPDNMGSILTFAAEMGIVTIGVTFLMIAGEFDLSVGSIYGMSGVILVMLTTRYQTNIMVSTLVALGIACFVGFINGMITIKTGLPSLIATLGMMMTLRGMIYFVTGGYVYQLTAPPLFSEILSARIGGGYYRMSIVWFAIIGVILTVVLSSTKFGNWVFAVGGSRQTARSMGVKTDRVKLVSFLVCSFLAGFAGIISVSRFYMVMPSTGEGFELEIIASSVMGGNFIGGGHGTIVGACMGAILVSSVRSGIIMAGAPGYWYQAFVGVVLVVAGLINTFVTRRWTK